jgi:hypothetical protein
MNFENYDDFSDEQKMESFLIVQNFIKTKFLKNEHFFIGRLSGNETQLTGDILNKTYKHNDLLLNNMLHGAGIQFHSTHDIIEYINLYHNSVINSNMLGVWEKQMYSQGKKYYNILNSKYKNIKQICAQSLEFFYYIHSQHYDLHNIIQNKKILIISSHKITIEQQLHNVDKIFDRHVFNISNEYYVYKPPQQNAGNHDEHSWQYHYNNMKKDLYIIKNNIFNFDIAFVSSGGYGMIISDYIYSELKTSVIYIGGPLQLFFGIKGNRWLRNPKIFINEYWVHVDEKDKPKNILLCEGGCYW